MKIVNSPYHTKNVCRQRVHHTGLIKLFHPVLNPKVVQYDHFLFPKFKKLHAWEINKEVGKVEFDAFYFEVRHFFPHKATHGKCT